MSDSSIDLAKIRVVVIAAKAQQRQAFQHTLTQWGMTVLACISPEQLEPSHLLLPAQLWLVDSDYNEQLYTVLDSPLQPLSQSESRLPTSELTKPHVLVGFEPAPRGSEINLYAKWQRKLKRKLVSLLGLPSSLVQTTSVAAKRYQPWQKVVVLVVSSLNDMAAGRDFLNSLPSSLPIAIVLIFPPKNELNSYLHSLPKALTANNEWRCQVVDLSLNMQAGQCYIIPPELDVVCDSTGRLIVGSESNLTQSQSYIMQIVQNFSLALADQLICIEFADSSALYQSDFIDYLASQGSKLWQHKEGSSTSVSELNREPVQASVAQLAKHLQYLMTDSTETL